MGRNHLRVLQASPHVQALNIFDPFVDANSFTGRARLYSAWNEFIESGIDYCVVSAPTSSHKEIGSLLGKARIPSLIEKPLAASSDDASELVEIFESNDTIGVVGHIERFNPAVTALKDLLAENRLGSIRGISTKRVGPFSGRIKDVGVVKDLATHDIDLVTWLTGLTYDEVSSKIEFPLGNLHEDSLNVEGNLAEGISISHVVNWISPQKERSLRIWGDQGEIFADLLEKTVKFRVLSRIDPGPSIDDGEETIPIADEEPLVSEHLAFQNAIMTGSLGNLASLRDGLAVVSIAENFIESANKS
jgi:predicted dehydrogenase